MKNIVNELFEAIREVYVPTLPPDRDCTVTGHCVIVDEGAAGGAISFTTPNLSIHFTSTVATNTAETSVPAYVVLGLPSTAP
jgi:hypothetical protein